MDQTPPLASPRPLPVPNRDMTRINQSFTNSTQNTQLPPWPVNPIARQHSTSSEEQQLLGTQAIQLYCYYPESFYIANQLPTWKPRELQAFKDHCRLQWEPWGITLILEQPLIWLRDISTSPLNFQKPLVEELHHSKLLQYLWGIPLDLATIQTPKSGRSYSTTSLSSVLSLEHWQLEHQQASKTQLVNEWGSFRTYHKTSHWWRRQ